MLGQLPLDRAIRESLDRGEPTMAGEADSPLAAHYMEFARHTAGRLSRQPRNLKLDLPNIVLQNN